MSSDGWSTATRSSRRRRAPLWIAAALVAVLVVGYLVVTALRTASFAPAQASRTLTVRGPTLKPDWPDYGQSAFALGDGPVIGHRGKQVAKATASTAKLITVLVALTKKPLATGQDGPTITITDADVRNYERYVGVDGSVTPVRAGQRLTERDVIEAILLPSANNLADTLAIWTFGSLDRYRSAATAWVRHHGLDHTTIGSDASGYAPDTISTADDLVRLGQLAMANPVVRAISAQQSAEIPEVGTVYNVDTLLGGDGIVGVKTGNSDQNGGVFVGAAVRKLGGRTYTVITAISGAPTLDDVLSDSRDLLTSLTKQLADRVVVRKGRTLGSYDTPDGPVSAVAARDISLVQFGTAPVTLTVHLDDVDPGASGRTVGSIDVPIRAGVAAQSVPVVLADEVQEPSYLHDLLHP